MGGVDELVAVGEPLKEAKQLVLCRWMEVHTWFIKKKDRILVSLLRLDQENQVERKEPLETLATGLQLDLDIWSSIISYPDAEIVAIRVIADLVSPL